MEIEKWKIENEVNQTAPNLKQVSRPAHRPLPHTIAPRPSPPFLQIDSLCISHVVLKELVHVRAELRAADDRAELEVVFDASVVEVCRADDGSVFVDHHRLGVQDHRLALVDFHA